MAGLFDDDPEDYLDPTFGAGYNPFVFTSALGQGATPPQTSPLVRAQPKDYVRPDYPHPYDPQIKAYQDQLLAADKPAFTPEQQAQRKQANSQNYMLGMAAMLSGDPALQQAGGLVFKQALQQRTPEVTAHGSYDPISGTWTTDPEFRKQDIRNKLAALQKADAAGQLQWDKGVREDELKRELIQLRGNEARALRQTLGGGTPDPVDVQNMIHAVGKYQLDPVLAMARLPPAYRAQFIGQVMQQYPNYDQTAYKAKANAATAFTSGPQGNAMRSFAVAGTHLDQLAGLADALHNGDLQAVNRIANAWAAQTGDPAPTDFEAAKDVVSKEVIKAIVAGGGGVAERQELSTLMSNAKSPAQLAGVIRQYRQLMGAQHDALLQQRRAAGLPDSTLPNYNAEQTNDPLGILKK